MKKIDDFLTYKIDSDLGKILKLKYLPWVGKNVLSTKSRLLIVGESVYNWENEPNKRKEAQTRLDREDFARVVIYEHGIENPNSKRLFARNIEKVLGNNIQSESERINFWENIIFHELVQRPLENNKKRPTIDDYHTGASVLVSIIKITLPTKCVFLGTSWDKYKKLKNALEENFDLKEQHFDKINNAYPKILKIKELKCRIYFIKHPSKYFKAHLWKEFLQNN